jgi:hypothetical protein
MEAIIISFSIIDDAASVERDKPHGKIQGGGVFGKDSVNAEGSPQTVI